MAKTEVLPPFTGFTPGTRKFLAALAANNEREWFEAHRDAYERDLLGPARSFVVAMGTRLRTFAPGVQFEPKMNGSIFRMARDTRFSKDKTPYKSHLAIRFWDGEGDRSSGFYFRLEPGGLRLAGGTWMFEDEGLLQFRRDVADAKRGAALEKALAAVERAGFELRGEAYKRVPKPYDADHPRARWLRFGGLFGAMAMKAPKELTSAALVDLCAERYRKLLPLHRWLIERR